jgi:hypothetical protein
MWQRVRAVAVVPAVEALLDVSRRNTVETGTRNASLRVRIGDRTDPVLMSQPLASEISVIAGPDGRIGSESAHQPISPRRTKWLQ